MSIVIGCDVGTQSAKGIALDRSGQVLATATASYEVHFPGPSWAEQDAADWVRGVRHVLATVAAELGDAAEQVSHIAVDAQVDGVVATDASGTPLAPAIIWMDRRAAAEARRIEAAVGGDRLFAITGLNGDSSHAAPKMMWLRDQIDSPVHWYLPPAAMVVADLTGEVVQDHANASSSMVYDVRARGWSDALLAAAGLDAERLPRVAEAIDTAGTLRATVAAEIGLPPTCAVLVGTGDDHAAAVGAGVARPGLIADVTGTAEPIGAAATEPCFDAERLLETHAHAVPGMWLVENPGFVSGGSTLWLSRVLDIAQSEVFDLAAQAEPGSGGLVFIPALSGAMAPRWNERARGSFTGAVMQHGREELCRAVLEGCAYALRDNVDRIAATGLPSDEIRVTGGGARSDLWLQIKADVTGRIARPVMGEGAATGAACLAAAAAGWFADVGDASDALVPISRRTFDPEPDRVGRYDAAYACYRETYDALEPTFGSA